MKNYATSITLAIFCAANCLPTPAEDGGDFVMLPFRAASAVTGTPIAITRELPHNIKLCLGEYKDDNNSWKIMGALSTLVVAPFASVVKGCIAGPKNAFKHPVFSKDSFSLGELDEK